MKCINCTHWQQIQTVKLHAHGFGYCPITCKTKATAESGLWERECASFKAAPADVVKARTDYLERR